MKLIVPTRQTYYSINNNNTDLVVFLLKTLYPDYFLRRLKTVTCYELFVGLSNTAIQGNLN